MAATQAMTGQGGWPMTCFLTPDGEPFYCGTYYPTGRSSAGCRRSASLTRGLARTTARRVRERRPGEIAARLADNAAAVLPPAGLDADALDAAVADAAGRLRRRCTAGSAARRSSRRRWSLEFLLRHHERTGSADALRDRRA